MQPHLPALTLEDPDRQPFSMPCAAAIGIAVESPEIQCNRIGRQYGPVSVFDLDVRPFGPAFDVGEDILQAVSPAAASDFQEILMQQQSYLTGISSSARADEITFELHEMTRGGFEVIMAAHVPVRLRGVLH